MRASKLAPGQGIARETTQKDSRVFPSLISPIITTSLSYIPYNPEETNGDQEKN
jgi:hypothetical protein